MTAGGGDLRDRSSFVVLAGGGSRRMGSDKAFLRVGGREMLDRLLDVGRSACGSCVLAVGDPDPHGRALRRYGWEETDAQGSPGGGDHRRFRRGDDALRLVTDRRRGRGPVAGLAAGLGAAPGRLCFVAACDLPFLAPDVVAAALGELEELAGGRPGAAARRAVVPVAGDRRQPLAAAYTAGCATAARRCLEAGELSMAALLERLAEVRTVSASRLLDPDGPGDAARADRVFTNVNRPEELEAARRAVSDAGAGPGPAPEGGGRHR